MGFSRGGTIATNGDLSVVEWVGSNVDLGFQKPYEGLVSGRRVQEFDTKEEALRWLYGDDTGNR
ncbi:hypothetical protein DLJ53_20705 [Acuticoccus sediminis]|uniref:Uncharacterized protein n=2 Tax=Acuticoccus sediminis TaxID=2184697 RepID=A0A8B2NRZ3_9HYPH|nr:hypothetical protein DLJ53_20705 [Acuticoccus sediminis]